MRMAHQLQVSLSTTCSSSSSFRSPPSWPTKRSIVSSSEVVFRSFFAGEKMRGKIGVRNGGDKQRLGVRVVRSSLDMAGPVVAVGQVTEVTKDTFWPLVKSAGDKPVVLDMYTQWYISISTLIIWGRLLPGQKSLLPEQGLQFDESNTCTLLW